MISNIATMQLLGLPVILYGGILTYLLLLSTFTIGFLNYRGIRVIPFKWHPRLAIATVTVATIHALLGLSLYLNF